MPAVPRGRTPVNRLAPGLASSTSGSAVYRRTDRLVTGAACPGPCGRRRSRRRESLGVVLNNTADHDRARDALQLG